MVKMSRLLKEHFVFTISYFRTSYLPEWTESNNFWTPLVSYMLTILKLLFFPTRCFWTERKSLQKLTKRKIKTYLMKLKYRIFPKKFSFPCIWFFPIKILGDVSKKDYAHDHVHHLPAMWPWTGYLAYLDLRCSIYKKRW